VESETKELPVLVDNMEKFHSVEKETPTDEAAAFKQEARSTIKYPLVGSLLSFEGQLFVVTKELGRHRFIIKWRKGP
jgi:hypothetical protein